MRPWLLRADQCRTLTLRIIEESLKLPPRLWRLAHRSTRGAGAQRRWLDTTEKTPIALQHLTPEQHRELFQSIGYGDMVLALKGGP